MDNKNVPAAKTEASSSKDTPDATTDIEVDVISEASSDNLDLDADIFEKIIFHIGDYGTYQKWLTVAMIPFGVFFAWVYFTPMFIVATPQTYWCFVPELSGLSKKLRRDLSAPGVTLDIWDGCQVFITDWQKVIETKKPPPLNTLMKPCTTGWEFDYEDIPYPTVVSERGWVCHQAKYVPTSHSIFFVGSFVGTLLFGWMADFYGRVPAIMAVNIVGAIGGIATVYTTGVWDFIICRFFCGLSFDNCLMLAYILVLEYVGRSHRTFVANLPIALFYGTGAVVLPWIAYFVANWRIFTYITSLPMFIVILAPWTMPESCRWYVSRGRGNDAVKVLKKFERINKTKIPEEVMKEFIATSKKIREKKVSILDMFKSANLRLTAFSMTVTYCGRACVYDGMVRISEFFGLNMFLTFTVNAIAEIPSVLLAMLLLDRLGRRNLTSIPMVVAGLCILISIFVPKGVPLVSIALIARFAINLSFTVTIQWFTEILPTPFRASATAALHTMGFASSLCAPFIVYSGRYWRPLPYLILCTISMICAVSGMTLPETNGLELPQTIADSEKIIEEYSLFKWKAHPKANVKI